jgi:hypothetical protein
MRARDKKMKEGDKDRRLRGEEKRETGESERILKVRKTINRKKYLYKERIRSII